MAKLEQLLHALSHLPEKILLGVSGGIDSMALLHALRELGQTPVVLHFNHGWRRESDEEAVAVRKLAREKGLRFAGGRGSAVAGRSEAEARGQRFTFFARAARRFGIPDLVLAHHADDQVETCFLQLLRGTGSLAGMRALSDRPDLGLRLHRPWLGVWKAEIREYAESRKLRWFEDASNLDTSYSRNRLRHNVFPILSQDFGKSWPLHLWQTAHVLEEERAWMDSLCQTEAQEETLDVAALRAHPLARQRRTVLLWLKRQQVRDISYCLVEAVVGLLHQPTPARINLQRGWWARRREGKIFLQRGTDIG